MVKNFQTKSESKIFIKILNNSFLDVLLSFQPLFCFQLIPCFYSFPVNNKLYKKKHRNQVDKILSYRLIHKIKCAIYFYNFRLNKIQLKCVYKRSEYLLMRFNFVNFCSCPSYLFNFRFKKSVNKRIILDNRNWFIRFYGTWYFWYPDSKAKKRYSTLEQE